MTAGAAGPAQALPPPVQAGSVIPAMVDNGTWAACFGLSWTGLMMHDQAVSGRIVRPGGQYLRKVAGTMGVAAGRNEIVAGFLATDAQWLFMIDTDMGFAPDTVDRLVASAEAQDAPVMGGLCFALKADLKQAASFHGVRHRVQPTVYEYLELDNGERGFRPLLDYKRDTVSQVAATGAACLLMRRDALVAVGPDPFQPIHAPGAGGNGTARTFSEDLSFCVRLAAADIAIHVDTAVKTTHDKGALFLDEDAFDQQQQGVQHG